jgi:preprotein translocase subunit YajC
MVFLFMAPPSGAEGGGSPLAFPLMMGILILIMYFLVIRPQQRAAKKQQAMINAVTKGDRVLTTGGIYGKVVGVHDHMVVLQIARDVNVEVQKSAIAGVANPEAAESKK